MTIDEAIEVLELHNQWRKGAEVEMQDPVRIGMAIDLVICELKTLRKQPDVSSVCRRCGAKTASHPSGLCYGCLVP